MSKRYNTIHIFQTKILQNPQQKNKKNEFIPNSTPMELQTPGKARRKKKPISILELRQGRYIGKLDKTFKKK
jgi:hypothetical protein